MIRNRFTAALGGLLFLVGALPASASTSYSEGVQGELSDDYQNPTQVSATSGSNTVTGAVVAGDLDYVTINLPANHQLDAIVMNSYANPSGFDEVAFIGAQAGTAFTFAAEDAFDNIDNMLGWAHFGPGEGDDPGEGILDPIFAGGSLAGSAYTFWIQQTGSDTNYTLDFTISPVPEPASCALVVLGAVVVPAMRRRASAGRRAARRGARGA